MNREGPGPVEGHIVVILVETPEGLRREHFAVAREDRSEAEWAALDRAQGVGRIADGPRGGEEPVQTLAALRRSAVRRFGLKAGEVRPLGPRPPRAWLAAASPTGS